MPLSAFAAFSLHSLHLARPAHRKSLGAYTRLQWHRQHTIAACVGPGKQAWGIFTRAMTVRYKWYGSRYNMTADERYWNSKGRV
jgi:hypothetical protein